MDNSAALSSSPPLARSAPRDLRSLVDRTVELPAMPAIAQKVMQAVDDPNGNADDLASIIETDPAISAWVMRVSNSAIFGRRRKVTSLNQAVLLLGLNELRNLVVAASVRHLYRRFGPLERENWAHALAIGIGARVVATQVLPALKEGAFLAGQLHDVGEIVMLNQMPGAFAAIRAAAKRGDSIEAEEAAFGFAHTDVGSLLMQRWNMPPQLEAAAFYHHDLSMCEALSVEQLPLAACVALAEWITGGDGSTEDDGDENTEVALRALNVSRDDVADLHQAICEAIAHERDLLGK